MNRLAVGWVLALLGCGGAAGTSVGDGPLADVPAADRPDAATPDATELDAPRDVVNPPPDVTSDVSNDSPAAQGFTAPIEQWTWIDVDGMVCGDGTPTGVGVSLAEDPAGVLVVLGGGGACWDEQTCFVIRSATAGPFGAAQFAPFGQAVQGVVDRRGLASPFRTWSMVFVPGCTGDMFLGDRVAAFGDGGAERTWHFRGRANLARILPRVAATRGAATAVAILGVSFSGVGAVYNHALIRDHLRSGRVYPIADSGLLLDTGAVARARRGAWFDAWGAGWIDARCPTCRDNPIAIFAANASSFPNDRAAVISSRQDTVLAQFHGAAATDYESTLRVAVDALPPLHRAFVVSGNGHVFATRDGMFNASDNTYLYPWLGEMLGGGAWDSHAF